MNQQIKTPLIFKETSDGTLNYAIQDEMLRLREIDCIGDITQESVYSIILQLRYLQKESPDQEITMYINSPGGDVINGLALYDVIKSITCPIRTVCVAQASSMAALLFASGNKREMLPHAKIMIHDPRAKNISGTALEINEHSKGIMNARELIATIISKHTGKTIDEILEKTASDCYFDAEEAIEFGLADSVLERF